MIAALLASMLAVGVAQAAPGPLLSVDATGPHQHPISADIYGLNFADHTLAGQLSLPVDRWGGNATETYNYRIGADNTGNDYYFENIADCFSQEFNWCYGLSENNVFAYRNFVAGDRSTNTKTLLTLPMAGYVAKDAPVGHPLTCGYPKTQWPSQDSFDPYDPNCGNGMNGGVRITGNPANDGLKVGASFDSAWVNDLIKRYGTAAAGGVKFYELGNEPALWSDTHADIHPAPETADELWDKSRALATAVKQDDPSAKVVGFSDWGWPAYFCSGADTPGDGCDQNGCTTSPDCSHHAHLPVVEWYLRQFANYDNATGVRHLDYLDVHYYAQGGSSTDVTRSLWDPRYTDPSWIDAPIYLIPRMKCWITGHVAGICPKANGYYPGTKLSLSEYNLSLPGVSARTNAIIQADTLGIFAREGLSLATRWGMSYDGDLIADAFKIYRDYDYHHSKFGDTWIPSTSTNQSAVAVYGARRSSDGAYTILVINKSGSALRSRLKLTGISSAGPAQTYQWTGGAIKQVSGGTPISSGEIDASYPGLSMTLYVIG